MKTNDLPSDLRKEETMTKNRAVLKQRFVNHPEYYLNKDGSYSTIPALVLPGEDFDFSYIPEMYESEDDPDDALREDAADSFEEKLFTLGESFGWLGFRKAEHWYDKNDEPCYQCVFPHYDAEHKEQYMWETVKADDGTLNIVIKTHDFEELELRLEVALEDWVTFNPWYNDLSNDPGIERIRPMIFRHLIENKTELRESDEFWWLLDQLIFGSEASHIFARERVNKLIAEARGDPTNYEYRKKRSREARKAELHRMNSPGELNIIKTFEECNKEGIALFERFINNAIDNGIIHSPSGLANSVGVKPNYLSNARTGKRKLSKAAAIRLGVGLQLSSRDMTRFMASLDHCFPITPNDRIICLSLDKKIYDLNELVSYLPKERTDENKVK